MKQFPVHPVTWSTFLVLFASQCESNIPGICHKDWCPDELCVEDSSHPIDCQSDTADVNECFTCLLYPAEILNCSWAFHTLQKDTQLSVHISICEGEQTAQAFSRLSEERVGSWSTILPEHEGHQFVIVQFNMTLHDNWTAYTYTYEPEKQEVLSPPPNLSASVKDGDLLVTWDLPHSHFTSKDDCFDYQLDLGDQESLRNLTNQRSYTLHNADPAYTYRVRIRTMKNNLCIQWPHWSDWSHTVIVEQSVYKLNTLVILSVSFVIPMILLAVLLLVCHQRVFKLLFPPIPRPPPKYIQFLQKNDTFNFFHPAHLSKAEEEITQVEDTE
uniref:uncharacterized protein LOC109974072 n=1 Tax=Monopterus albus TaxID=43700 RepID=UPI0009B429CE|nr:uncharacterized protein LOC109974072 [Monopterus albus]